MPKKVSKGVHREDIVARVAEKVRDSGYKKPVFVPAQTLHVSDDCGNVKNFTLKHEAKEVNLSKEDVRQVLKQIIPVVEEALANGERISLVGFGELGLHYRPPRYTYAIGTHERVEVKGRFSPKFVFGEGLRRAARLFELKTYGECGLSFEEDPRGYYSESEEEIEGDDEE